MDPTAEPHTVAVLSPYTQQVAAIDKSQRDLSPAQGFHLASAPSAGTGEPTGRWAYTVDSFQGNQADTVIVSLVRNNARLPQEGLGFLKDYRRINVAFSRAERLLVIVGSWDFFVKQLEHVSIENEADGLWFWKKLLATLQEYFASGEAIKIPFRSISPESK